MLLEVNDNYKLMVLKINGTQKQWYVKLMILKIINIILNLWSLKLMVVNSNGNDNLKW